jgi:hypothetical protein
MQAPRHLPFDGCGVQSCATLSFGNFGRMDNGPDAVPELRLSRQHRSREVSKVRRADPVATKATTARSNGYARLRLTNAARHRHSLTGDHLLISRADVRPRLIRPVRSLAQGPTERLVQMRW